MKEPILSFGEILYDVFPDSHRLGGAPFNFAYHLHAFGFPSVLVSRVGDDAFGRKILAFAANSFHGAALQIDPRHGTGRVVVEVDELGVPTFDILDDVAYDYIAYDGEVEKIVKAAPPLVYFGTLAQRHEISRSTLKRLIGETGPSIFLYDMNLRPPYYSKDVVAWSLTTCHGVKLNEDELELCRSFFPYGGGGESWVRTLMERFDLKWVCLTRGERGSALYGPSGPVMVEQVPQYNVVDTVGAGDAYTAILALGLLKGWTPETILERATSFAGAICQERGAIPQEDDFYAPYRSWVEDQE